MDGLSYYMKVDTTTGHFKILSQMDEDDDNNKNSPPTSSGFTNDISNTDKQIIQQRFFELSNKN
jgi:hypothetical protein